MWEWGWGIRRRGRAYRISAFELAEEHAGIGGGYAEGFAKEGL